LILAVVNRLEKRESHDMIPVRVREKQIDAESIFPDQFVAESTDAGSRVNNDDIPGFGSDFNAGGVAAVFDIVFPRNGNRTP